MRATKAFAAVLAFTGLLAVATPAMGITSKTELLSAPVPSACGHPAGTLVNGSLPGVPENQGGVALDTAHVALGRIIPKGGTGAVAALTCSQGGVGWPQVLVFYNADLELIHHVNLFKVTRGGRESVRRISIAKRVVTAQVVAIEQKGDLASGGTGSALLKFGWNAKTRRMRLTSRTMYNERAAAAALVSAVRAGNVAAARRYASADDVAGLTSSALRKTFQLSGCVGPLSEDPLGSNWFQDEPRRCYVTAASGGSLFRFIGLRMAPTGWRAWHVGGVTYYAG